MENYDEKFDENYDENYDYAKHNYVNKDSYAHYYQCIRSSYYHIMYERKIDIEYLENVEKNLYYLEKIYDRYGEVNQDIRSESLRESRVRVEQLEYILKTGKPEAGMTWEMYDLNEIHNRLKTNLERFLTKI